MATNTFVELNIPEASELADLTGIKYDLETARDFAKLHLEAYKSQPASWHNLTDALTTAVCVRYARPFSRSNKRRRLEEDSLERLTEEQRLKHDRLIAIRNKYSAHSENAFEESQPIARYWLERVQEEGIAAIECQHSRIVGLSPAELNSVIELTEVFLVYVQARREKEKARLLPIVRALPLTQVLSGVQSQAYNAYVDPSQPRKRF